MKRSEPEGWDKVVELKRERLPAQSSREHHWWPVALQSHWAVLGKVSFIEPSGKADAKSYKNEKMGRKAHGHTISHSDKIWAYNFEGKFKKADDRIHAVVRRCLKMFSGGYIAKTLWRALLRRTKGEQDLSIFRAEFKIDTSFRRDLVLLCLSLLILSPANRDRLERVGSAFGLPRSEDVGKVNIHLQVDAMNREYERSYHRNIFPLIIYSYRKEFLFGDGLLDGMTSSLQSNLRGHAMVPLTPHICVFLSCPTSVRSDRNAALLLAPDWLVDEINEVTQVYSKRFLFYASQKPNLSDAFERGEHLMYEHNSSTTINTLKELCGEPALRWKAKWTDLY